MIKNLQSLFNINECCIFFSYIKVSKDSSDKHNQNNKKKNASKNLWKVSTSFWRRKEHKARIWLKMILKFSWAWKTQTTDQLKGEKMDKIWTNKTCLINKK